VKSDAALRLHLFVVITALAGLAGLTLAIVRSPFSLSPLLVALLLAAMTADVMTVELGSISVSTAYPILVATVILLGPAVGGLVAGLSAIPSALLVSERRLLRGVFNSGQLTLAFLAAGWVYGLAGGRALAGAPLSVSEIPGVVLPLALVAATALLINTSMVAVVVTLSSGVSLLSVWKSSFAWSIPVQASLTLLALSLAQVVAAEGIVGLGLFAVPLLIARQFYERYVTLRRTYADTVRSLVAVIEAKDSYTKGHSERVAAYSVEIARRLGFNDQRIERIELAALLHDLGKVGISKEILSKSSRLNQAEYREIQTHPEIGARIIESVPFLADLIPFIATHHERIDGSGYGSQLSGEDIPVEARVLSVADAFDAMTSSRPYRAALSREETVRELRRCAGQQFDPVVVEVFVEALDNSVFAAAEPTAVIDEAG
jgi:putative nucleotidyltransferase with HDIG domain